MDIEKLKAMGGILPSAMVPKEINWVTADGEEVSFTVFVRRLSYGESVAVFKDVSRDEEINQAAWKIAACVRLGENGEQKLTYDEAMALDLTLGVAMCKACNEVNGFGGESKNSRPPTSSGASLSSQASAAEPSKKHKKTSATRKSTSGRHIVKSADHSMSAPGSNGQPRSSQPS